MEHKGRDMLSVGVISLTAIGLSGDAFAASLARGTSTQRTHKYAAVRNGLVFGSVEGAMCLLGWLLAASINSFVGMVDHWIAITLLSAIGGHMIYEALQDEEAQPAPPCKKRTRLTLLLTAIGTSIDSAVVGGALNLSGASAHAALIVAAFSTTLSTIGFMIGPIAGQLAGKRAGIAGGIILIAIGSIIWTEHMFF